MAEHAELRRRRTKASDVVSVAPFVEPEEAPSAPYAAQQAVLDEQRAQQGEIDAEAIRDELGEVKDKLDDIDAATAELSDKVDALANGAAVGTDDTDGAATDDGDDGREPDGPVRTKRDETPAEDATDEESDTGSQEPEREDPEADEQAEEKSGEGDATHANRKGSDMANIRKKAAEEDLNEAQEVETLSADEVLDEVVNQGVDFEQVRDEATVENDGDAKADEPEETDEALKETGTALAGRLADKYIKAGILNEDAMWDAVERMSHMPRIAARNQIKALDQMLRLKKAADDDKGDGTFMVYNSDGADYGTISQTGDGYTSTVINGVSNEPVEAETFDSLDEAKDFLDNNITAARRRRAAAARRHRAAAARRAAARRAVARKAATRRSASMRRASAKGYTVEKSDKGFDVVLSDGSKVTFDDMRKAFDFIADQFGEKKDKGKEARRRPMAARDDRARARAAAARARRARANRQPASAARTTATREERIKAAARRRAAAKRVAAKRHAGASNADLVRKPAKRTSGRHAVISTRRAAATRVAAARKAAAARRASALKASKAKARTPRIAKAASAKDITTSLL